MVCAVVENCVSLAVSCRTYAPFAENVACVTGECALANVTGPGPLTTAQVIVSGTPAGRPSSVTVPFNVVVIDGSVTV